MASNNFKAGEAKGQAEEKANQATSAMKNSAQAAKDSTFGAAQAVKDKTFEVCEGAQGQANQTGGYIADRAGDAKKMAVDATTAATKKGSEVTQTSRDTAVVGKDKSVGVFAQAGEQVMNYAQVAADAVKNTVGMGDKK